jgi:hypothetical protein
MVTLAVIHVGPAEAEPYDRETHVGPAEAGPSV